MEGFSNISIDGRDLENESLINLKDSLYKNIDGFINIGNNFFAIKGENNYMVYNSLFGNPFVIKEDIFQKIINNSLSQEEKDSLLEMGYQVESIKVNSREEYENIIKNYIENYKGPKVLDLSISEMCNLNCHMCIHSYARQKDNPRSETKIMNFETAKLRIDYYIDYMIDNEETENMAFHFGAAEPMLNQRVLFKCLAYIKDKLGVLNMKFDLSVNTNFTVLTDNIINKLSQYDIRINIGLDGNQEQNDSIRIDRNGKGTFNKIFENINKTSKLGFNIGINLTLTDKNFDSISPKEFINIVKSLGVDSMLVDIDFIQGVKNNYIEVVNKLMEFQKLGDSEGIQMFGNRKAPFLNLTSEKGEEIVSFCHASKGKNLSVTPSQKLTFCTYSSNILTQLENSNIQESFNNFVDNMKIYMNEKMLHNFCLGCCIEGICNGGCHVTHEQKTAIEYMCKIYKEATKELLKYYFGNADPDNEKEIISPSYNLD